MRVSIVLYCLLTVFYANGQSKYDSIIFISYGGGVNYESSPRMESKPYSIAAIENYYFPGVYMQMGVEIKLKKRIGIHIEGMLNTLSINEKKFKEVVAENYAASSNTVLFSNTGISGGGHSGWKGSISYSFVGEKIILQPRISYGKLKGFQGRHSFVVRELETNSFQKFWISNKSVAHDLYSIGCELFLAKLFQIGLNFDIGYTTTTNNYNISITDSQIGDYEEVYSDSYNQFLFRLGLALRFDIFQKGHSINTEENK